LAWRSAEPLTQLFRSGTGPADPRIAISGVHRSAGEDVGAWGERHRRGPPQHEDLHARARLAFRLPDHHDGRGVPWRRGRQLAGRDGGTSPRHPLAEPVKPDPHADTSTIISTSTGASSGRTAIPTALRACRPDSPSTSMRNSLAPLMTCACPVNPGALATK